MAQIQPNMVGATNADPLAQSGRAFAQAVYMNDKFEILAGKLAVEKGARAVARFRPGHDRRPYRNRRKTSRRSWDITLWAGSVTPPPVLDPPHMDMYHALEASWGRNFDRIYLAQQRDVHEEALDVMEGYVENGRVADLQDFAHHMVPVVSRPHRHAAQCARRGRRELGG